MTGPDAPLHDPGPTEHAANAEEAAMEDPTTGPASSTAPVPPKPAPPRPRPPAPRPPATQQAVVPDSQEVAEASRWGRVDQDNTVWVREADGERQVGQYPGADSTDALAYFVRKFLEIQAPIALFETRIDSTDLTVKEIDSTLAKLSASLVEPAAVGDLDGLRARLAALEQVAVTRRAAAEDQTRQLKAQAVAQRTSIVEKAEALADRDPAKVHWRQAGDELRGLLDEWKSAQASGPRVDRPTEEALWKRFSAARTTFDRNRRHYFAALEERNSEARNSKERLVERAEALASSTDWGDTAREFRDLMDQWRTAGHAGRSADDALWQRFRAAQDTFFDARSAVNAQIDAEYSENLAVKLALLDEAEALLPIKDLGAAKASLRIIQDKWDAAGRVPRADMQSTEARIRAVEQAIRHADDEAWKRSNPETKARVEGMTRQLEDTIAALEADLLAAQATGNTKKVADVEQALATRRSWLEQILSSED